jgi:hypothetical protein
MPPIGIYTAIAMILVILVVFLFIYTDRWLRKWPMEGIYMTEGFASVSQLSTSEKTVWKERLPNIVAFLLFQGFLITNPDQSKIISILNPIDGKRGFLDLWSYLLDADGARYYTDQLWTDFIDWESKFPYDTKPLTYMELLQFAKSHRMFSGDAWNQTMAKTTTNTMSTLTYYYNLVLQMERMLSQAVPSNPLAVSAVAKRGRYVACALDNSTDLQTFSVSLVGLGVKPIYVLYTVNDYFYERLKGLKAVYRDPALTTRVGNLMFLYYQWEILLTTTGTGEMSRMTSTLDALPDQCANLSISPPAPSPSSASSATPATTPTPSASTASTASSAASPTSGTYGNIPTPTFKKIVIPPILVPKIVPQVPKDAVAFTPFDTKEDRKVFFIVTLVFLGIIFILWDLMFYMWFTNSNSGIPVQSSETGYAGKTSETGYAGKPEGTFESYYDNRPR